MKQKPSSYRSLYLQRKNTSGPKPSYRSHYLQRQAEQKKKQQEDLT
jgi:hypothetical protein